MNELRGRSKVLALVIFVAIQVWMVWCLVVAFIGGTYPLTSIKTQGGLGTGLLFLLLIGPVLETVAYWLALGLTILVTWPFEPTDRDVIDITPNPYRPRHLLSDSEKVR